MEASDDPAKLCFTVKYFYIARQANTATSAIHHQLLWWSTLRDFLKKMLLFSFMHFNKFGGFSDELYEALQKSKHSIRKKY